MNFHCTVQYNSELIAISITLVLHVWYRSLQGINIEIPKVCLFVPLFISSANFLVVSGEYENSFTRDHAIIPTSVLLTRATTIEAQPFSPCHSFPTNQCIVSASAPKCATCYRVRAAASKSSTGTCAPDDSS